MLTLAPDAQGVNVHRPQLAKIALDPDVPVNEKTVLLALIAHDGGSCYRAITMATGLSGSTLQHA
jgi:hypothetical protein